MPSHNVPLVDNENPLYCPDFTVKHLRSSILVLKADSECSARWPYFHALMKALDTKYFDSPPHRITNTSYHPSPTSPALDIEKVICARRYLKNGGDDARFGGGTSQLRINRKRDIENSSSGSPGLQLRGPTKRVKHSSSEDGLSFLLSARADRLHFPSELSGDNYQTSRQPFSRGTPYHAEECFWPDSEIEENPVGEDDRSFETSKLHEKLRNLEGKCDSKSKWGLEGRRIRVPNVMQILIFCPCSTEELYGPSAGPESPGSLSLLFSRLEGLLPGVRIRDQLNVPGVTHQDIVNLLGLKGKSDILS